MLSRRCVQTIALLALCAGAAVQVGAVQFESGSGEGTRMTFRYQSGQVQKFRGTIKTDMTVAPEGGGASAASIPVGMNMAVGFTEKVLGVKNGTGTIRVAFDSMSLNLNAMGGKFSARLQNGNVVATANGKPINLASDPRGRNLQSLANQQPRVVRRDARGRETLVSGPPSTDQTMWGEAFLLPKTRVSAGDSWDDVQRIRPQVPGVSARELPPIAVQFTYTLTDLVTRNGRQIAIIETNGSNSAESSGGPVQSLNLNITGITRFDVKRGAILSGQYTVDTSAAMTIPVAQPDGGGTRPTKLQIDGTTQINFSEVTPAAPRKPAGKPAPKPAKK